MARTVIWRFVGGRQAFGAPRLKVLYRLGCAGARERQTRPASDSSRTLANRRSQPSVFGFGSGSIGI
jgi:hypothetical protein